jgi:hypothetical protein
MQAMPRPARLLLLVAFLVTAWLISHSMAPGLDGVWLSLAPLLVLVLSLADDRYVGEEAIARIAVARRLRVPATSAPPAPRRRAAEHRRGGVVLACGSAGRAPPSAALAA